MIAHLRYEETVLHVRFSISIIEAIDKIVGIGGRNVAWVGTGINVYMGIAYQLCITFYPSIIDRRMSRQAVFELARGHTLIAADAFIRINSVCPAMGKGIEVGRAVFLQIFLLDALHFRLARPSFEKRSGKGR